MEKQELEELFPVGCVVSADIKEKLGFGKWVWIQDHIDYELAKKKTEEAYGDMQKDPDKWFTGGHFCRANNLPPYGLIHLYKRIN